MGALLFNGNCITCHHETQCISAPSIHQIREKYLRAFPQEKDFIQYMSTWVLTPNKETSIMLNAIERYELMPQLGYDFSTLQEISKYLYETEFKLK